MSFIHGANRHEEILFPERLDDYIAEDNPVRFIDAFVDHLNLTTLGFQRATPATTGRPAYHPADLLKLYMYGYLYRLRSSRRLEQETHRNVELLWLLKKLRPDHKTIADFRKNNLVPIRQVCREFTLLCKQLDLFAGELVAIDGSKFKAVNAKARNFTSDKLQRLLQQIDQRVEGYLQELDRGDNQEDAGTPGGAVAAHVQAKIAALQHRQLLYADLQAQLEASGATQLSLTDPESRAMKLGKGRGIEVCYNVQTAVDSKHKLIVANDVTNAPGDRDCLSPMALQAKDILGSPFEAVADVGYYHGEEVKTCLEAGITPYIARPITSANEKLGLFSKDDFRYDRATDTYQCPASARLTFRFDAVEHGRHIRYYATSACGGCALKPQCTRSKGGRRITRWVDEFLLEAMEQRVRRRPEVMKQRKQLVEHPFGTMKRWWDAGYFLMRGLEKVRTEFSLTVLAYNLRRVVNLVAMPRLLAALG
jgi:transposase